MPKVGLAERPLSSNPRRRFQVAGRTSKVTRPNAVTSVARHPTSRCMRVPPSLHEGGKVHVDSRNSAKQADRKGHGSHIITTVSMCTTTEPAQLRSTSEVLHSYVYT